jgi:hypothetical protein
MKLINFRKIGTVLAIAVFGFISFTAGVDLTQNANSTASSSVLPIVKGGTGSNTASGATANILGNNFENYSGILPVEKGGIGVDGTTDNEKINAQYNLGLQSTYTYPGNSTDQFVRLNKTYYFMTSYNGNYRNMSFLVTGSSSHANLPVSFLIESNSRQTQDNHSRVSYTITSLSSNCFGPTVIPFYIVEYKPTGTGQNDTRQMELWMKSSSNSNAIKVTVQYLQNAFGNKTNGYNFAPMALNNLPYEEGYDIKEIAPKCAAYSPAYTPLPYPTPLTSTP